MSQSDHGTRLLHEIEHGKKLTRKGAESIWNWSSPAGQRRADRRAGYLFSVGKIGEGDRVLEIGCGTGLFTRKVWELSKANITATDLSEDLLSIAKQQDGIGSGDYQIGDAMDLQFPNKTFDVVFGSSILHHLDFDRSLREIFRVLKVGGRMVFAEPNMLNPQIFIQKNIPFIKRWLGDSPDETAIIRWRFAKIMKKIGFSNIKIFTYDFLHPSTPKSLIGIVNTLGIFIENIPLLKEIAGSVVIYGERS